MIGRVRFPCHRRFAEASLREDGRWQCPEVPSLVRVLDTLYSPERDGVDAGSPRAVEHLHGAARWLKGTVVGVEGEVDGDGDPAMEDEDEAELAAVGRF